MHATPELQSSWCNHNCIKTRKEEEMKIAQKQNRNEEKLKRSKTETK